MPSNEDMKWIQNAGNPGQHQSAFNFVAGLKSQTKGRKSWEQIFPHLPKGTFTRELVRFSRRAAVREAERSCGRVHFFGGAVWGNFRENANCGDPPG